MDTKILLSSKYAKFLKFHTHTLISEIYLYSEIHRRHETTIPVHFCLQEVLYFGFDGWIGDVQAVREARE